MAKTKEVEESSVIDLEEVSELWKAVFSGTFSHETVFILADGPEMALRKALSHQCENTIIFDWPLTSLDRVSLRVI
jgi:hypothetical protein